ncbi:MAG: glutamate racemase [bacterium]
MAEISQVRHVLSGKVMHKITELSEKPQATESSPIGMFDSGVGGLTVFEKVSKLLPRESIIYLADTARVPYGGRSNSEIIKINKEILALMLGFGVKLIMIACGTSSSIAYPLLKDKYKVPMIGMIEGGSRLAAAATKNKKVGVIATVGTINSLSYQKAIKDINKEIEVYGAACPLLVPLIEGGFAASEETEKVLKEYLKPLRSAKIDTLVLGCTHYPHLSGTIKSILGPGIALIDPADEAAKTARDILTKGKMTSTANVPPKHRFLVTGGASSFKELGSRLLGRPIAEAEEISIVKGSGER